jgi:hypothetical protein
VTRQRLDDREIGVRYLEVTSTFLFVTKRELGPTKSPNQGVLGSISPEIKQNENEAKYFHQVLSFGTCGAVPPLCRALLWNGSSVRTVA